MLKHTAHRWLIGALLAASVMVVASAGASMTTASPWPAKCKTVACVNTYLNAMHNTNVVRSAQIATLHGQMTTNNAQHAVYTEEMKVYDKTIADMKATLADTKAKLADTQASLTVTKATLADMQATIAALKTSVASLQAWQADLKANLSHVDVTVGTDGSITAVVKPTTPMIYMLLFEKAGSPPPPVFP